MKIGKVWLVGLLVGVFIGFFAYGTAHTQDLTIWEGKWFKITQKNTEVSFYESEMRSHTSTTIAYFKITEWDSANKQLKGINYDVEEEGYDIQEFSLDIIAGNNLDFLCWTHFGEGEDGFMGLTMRVQGKMVNGVLKSGTIKSLGGFYWGKAENVEEYHAGGISLTGKLISESKVPPEIR
jgi:hypothetical protein